MRQRDLTAVSRRATATETPNDGRQQKDKLSLSWGQWAVEVKTGRFQLGDLGGLLEFVRRHPDFRPLVICDESGRAVAERASLSAITRQDFLLDGPPR